MCHMSIECLGATSRAAQEESSLADAMALCGTMPLCDTAKASVCAKISTVETLNVDWLVLSLGPVTCWSGNLLQAELVVGPAAA